MKIATVVVTYNRKDMLLKNIECLLNQTRKSEKIYIIDNASTDGTREYINGVINNNKNDILYVRLEENSGGAGGFFKGLELAYKDGYEYVWGMDDDAFPKEDALEKIVEYLGKNPEAKCLWSNCNNDSLEFDENGVKEVESWMFVGFFISKDTIKKVGLPRREFFIYHDDTEYAERIIKNNFKILKLRDSIIEHGDFNNREILKRKIGGRVIEYPKMPDWKLYYYIRNFLLKYSYKDIKKYNHIFYHIPKDIIKVYLLNKSQCKIMIKAYIDGIIGISGKKEFK